jgi:exopolysaccharide production protein ExoQ
MINGTMTNATMTDATMTETGLNVRYPPRAKGPQLRIAWAEVADWLACFVSILALQLSTLAGSAAIVFFLAPWGLVVIGRPQQALDAARRGWPMLAYPLAALASAFWSIDPEWTLRGSVQLFLTILAGLWAGYCLSPRTALSATMAALAVVVASSAALGTESLPDPETGETALIGLFDTKNFFAFSVVNLMLFGGAAASDPSQPRLFRLLGAVSLLLSPPVLIAAKSVGAMVNCAAALAVMAVLKLFARFSALARLAIFGVLLFLGVLAGAAAMVFPGGTEAALGAVGKDSTLTGRAYLWERAGDFIAERPLAGVGFEAFWRRGNPDAEDLWYYSAVESGAGFNFHNLYLHILVDLGVIGLAVMLATLIAMIGRAALCLLGPLHGHVLLGVGVFAYLMLSSPIEVCLNYQFQFGTVAFCLAWAYLAPPQNRALR